MAVVGSTHYPDLPAVRRYIEGLPSGATIVSGEDPGVDRVAIETARELGLATIEHEADWGRFGRRAGILRNKRIVYEVEGRGHVAAFWDGKSIRTGHLIGLARQRGVRVRVIPPREPNRHPGDWALL